MATALKTHKKTERPLILFKMWQRWLGSQTGTESPIGGSPKWKSGDWPT